MNSINQKLTEFARANYSSYKHKGISDILIAGSTSRNIADKFSDLELIFLWEDSTESEINKYINEHIHPQNYLFDRENNTILCDIMHENIKVDMTHITLNNISTLINLVNTADDAKYESQKLLSNILDGHPILNKKFSYDYKDRIPTSYTEDLQMRILKKHLNFSPFNSLRVHLERGQLFSFYKELLQNQENYLYSLLALNKIYYFGFKNITYLLNRLEFKPDNIEERFYEIYKTHNYNIFKDLVIELFDLTSQLVANFDISKPKNKFFYFRPEIVL